MDDIKEKLMNAVNDGLLDSNEVVEKLLEYIDVTSIDEATINKALKQDPTDFEDAVQYFSSLESNPDLIITRDKKGFNGSSIPFMDAKKFLQSCGYSSDSPQG